MNKPSAYTDLLTTLTPDPERSWCRVAPCTGCDQPHLRDELLAFQVRHGREALADCLRQVFQDLFEGRLKVREGSAFVPGMQAVYTLAADLLPRTILARMQLLELQQDFKNDKTLEALYLMITVVATWPELAQRVSQQRLPPQSMVNQVATFLQAQINQASVEVMEKLA